MTVQDAKEMIRIPSKKCGDRKRSIKCHVCMIVSYGVDLATSSQSSKGVEETCYGVSAIIITSLETSSYLDT